MSSSHGSDTRIYSTTRLLSIAGYDDEPIIDNSFSIRLPRLTQRSGRIVRTAGGVLELWLPNSDILPFYPGVAPRSFRMEIPSKIMERRYDGHLGRFDFTMSPQCYDKNHQWRGYVLRPCPINYHLPEFQDIHPFWSKIHGGLDSKLVDILIDQVNGLTESSKGNESVYPIRRDLWPPKCQLPSFDDLERLRTSVRFEDAIDIGRAIQRQIKDYDAWHQYVHICLNDKGDRDREVICRTPIPVANDAYIGIWINGAPESHILYEFCHGLPCFIAHKLSPSARSALSILELPNPDIKSGTHVVQLEVKNNGCDYLSQRYNHGYTHWKPTQATGITTSEESNTMSASASFGWKGPYFSSIQSSTAFLINNPPPELSPMPVEEELPIVTLSPIQVDRVSLGEDRVPWIRPPIVINPPQKKWSHWIEDWEDGVPTMRAVGKKHTDGLNHIYYDRSRSRVLYFDFSLSQDRGLISDVDIYGLPPPPYKYKGMNG